MRSRNRVAKACVVLAPLLALPLAGPIPAAAAHGGQGPLASSIAVDWQRTAIRTVYTERGSAPPLGALYLAFTSLAVHDAARQGQRHGTHAAAAAVAVAAHDVLKEYFPASGAALDADLAASLALVPDGTKQDAGVDIGAAAADEMIESRVGDGRNDATVVYNKTPVPGIWPPAAVPGGMALPWLGFVEPVIDVPPVALDGPDPISSAAYAQDYIEALELGSVGSATRTPQQTAVAQFFSGNPVLMYRAALCDLLDDRPLGLLPTTRLFARIDAATATTFIQTWLAKYEIGFWRPLQAIARADEDGNSATTPQAGWSPLITNPAYSEYTSGHGSGTAPFAEVVRRTFGDATPLVLTSGDVMRGYATLSALEHDALHARIWGGLHFRDSMEDTYHLGHATAGRVIRAIR